MHFTNMNTNEQNCNKQKKCIINKMATIDEKRIKNKCMPDIIGIHCVRDLLIEIELKKICGIFDIHIFYVKFDS